MGTTVRVDSSGSIELPAELCARYQIKEGDKLQVIDLDGVLILTPRVAMLPELVEEIERAREEAGLSVEEMLKGLREQRERYYKEKYI